VNTVIHAQVNEVIVPVTVKDPKGNPVAGLTWRDFTVYENNVREPLRVFSVDARPISVAFVIDQTLPSNYMREVNESMSAIQGALTPYDEAAVFTYTNGAKEWTGFTGAQGNRLPAVLSLAQSTGTDPMVPVTDGPLSGACPIYQNGNCADRTSSPRSQLSRSPVSRSPRRFTLSMTRFSGRPKSFPRVPRIGCASFT
jgi:hypothetical protein